MNTHQCDQLDLDCANRQHFRRYCRLLVNILFFEYYFTCICILLFAKERENCSKKNACKIWLDILNPSLDPLNLSAATFLFLSTFATFNYRLFTCQILCQSSQKWFTEERIGEFSKQRKNLRPRQPITTTTTTSQPIK